MLIRHFFTPGLCINSYLIIDEETHRGAVIDPTRQIEGYLARAKQEKIEITDIIETHVHADFISGSQELKAALGGKPKIHCSGLGGEEWTPVYADHVVQNRDAFHLGSLRFEAWHTPGHTPEHILWIVYDEHRSLNLPEIAFTGDLLFVGSVGRPDLLGPEYQETLSNQLYKSLFGVLHSLPDFLEIYPAHGAGSLCGKSIGMKLTSTLGYEKRCNPWLIPQDYAKWLDALQSGSLPIPGYYARMKHINVKGLDHSEKGGKPPLLTVEQFKKRSSDAVLVDFRSQEEFALGNIQRSVNIPFNPSLSLWAGSILPADKDLLLIVDHLQMVFPIIQALGLVGLDRISGVIDLSQWTAQNKKDLLKPSPLMKVETLREGRDGLCLVDVRNQHEWDKEHIEGALHIELSEFPKAMAGIPTDKPIAIVCHSGNRASIAASLLRKERGLEAFNVKGGMQEWNKQANALV